PDGQRRGLPVPRRLPLAPTRRTVQVLVALFGLAPQVHALRIVDYNLTNYPNNGSIRDPRYRTILAPLGADIVVTEEITGLGAAPPALAEFRDQVLNTLEPGQWAVAPFFNGNDTDSALFYKPSKVQIVGAWSFYPNPANLLRLITVWRIKPVGY